MNTCTQHNIESERTSKANKNDCIFVKVYQYEHKINQHRKYYLWINHGRTTSKHRCYVSMLCFKVVWSWYTYIYSNNILRKYQQEKYLMINNVYPMLERCHVTIGINTIEIYMIKIYNWYYPQVKGCLRTIILGSSELATLRKLDRCRSSNLNSTSINDWRLRLEAKK